MTKNALRAMEQRTFFEHFRPSSEDKPKHEQLRDALVDAIEHGYWEEGAQLPTEAQLTELTPFSLGTVQRAIRSLVNEGVVQRKRGTGTFVIPTDRRIMGPWFWRYLTIEESGFETMTTRVVERKRVDASQACSPLMRPDPKADYLQIDRIVQAGNLSFVSRYFVDCERFPLFIESPLASLNGANFGGLIRKVYRVKSDTISRTLKCAPLPDFVSRLLKRDPGELGIHLEIIGQSATGDSIFYNQLYLPPSDAKMFFQHSGF
jgi:GntR family transcriptional regulator